MPMHTMPCEIAGQFLRLKDTIPIIGNRYILIDDWFDRCFGTSWRTADGCVPAKEYGERIAKLYPNDARLAMSDAIVVGEIDGYQAAVHVTELDLPESKIESLYGKRHPSY